MGVYDGAEFRTSNHLPEDSGPPRLKKIVVPTKRKATFCIATSEPLICPVHTGPRGTHGCRKKNCTGCELGLEIRYKVYLHVFEPFNQYQNVLELTARGGQPVVDWFRQKGSTRGMKLVAWRNGVKENSPVESMVSTPSTSGFIVPEEIDLAAFLHRMWFCRDPHQTIVEHEEDRQRALNLVAENLIQERATLNGQPKLPPRKATAK